MSERDGASRRQPMPAQIGRYRVDGVLGRGAMGVVYRGFDEGIDRPVAIKTIHADLLGSAADAEWHERFRREARAAARCQHPNIVTIYEFGEHEGLPFLAMEFVTGGTLQDALSGSAWPKVARSLEIVRETLDAIGYAHGKGIIHRDLKPGNIMLLEGARVKVTDFGIARLGQSSVTQHGAIVGTPGYMSIEQFNGGTVDERSDLFAIGVILYQLLTGCMPFAGDNLPSIVYSMMMKPPPDPRLLNPTIPPTLSEVVMRAVAREPHLRFQSAVEFGSALLGAVQRTSSPPSYEPPTQPLPLPRATGGPAGAPIDTGPPGRTQLGTPLPSRHAPSPGTPPPAGSMHSPQPPHGAPLSGPSHPGTASYGTPSPLARPSAPGSWPQPPASPGPPGPWPQGPGSLPRDYPSGSQLSSPPWPPQGASAPAPGTPLPGPRTQPPTLGDQELARVTRDLTLVLGPIAPVLVRKAAGKVRSLAELYAAVATHITNEDDRKAFLRKSP